MEVGARVVTRFGGRLHVFRVEAGRVFAGPVKFQPRNGRWMHPSYLSEVTD